MPRARRHGHDREVAPGLPSGGSGPPGRVSAYPAPIAGGVPASPALPRKAALLADVVFAKGAHADWCERNGVVCRRFANLDEVRQALTPS